MLRALVSVALALAIAPAAARAAQAGLPASPGDPATGSVSGRGGAGLSNAELISMLDTYALVQAQQFLQIDDETYGQFVVRLKKLQETRRRAQRDRNQMIQEMRKLSAPQVAQPDERAIGERLKALREFDERAAADLRRAHDAVDELLSVVQQARFRVFEENMERRKLDLLVRARQRAVGPPRRGGS